jgi:hypothetical protein
MQFKSILSSVGLIIALSVTASAQKVSIDVTQQFVGTRDLGGNKARNTWRVDWKVSGPLPLNATQFSKFDVSVNHLGGIGHTSVNGSARTALVEVEVDASHLGGANINRPPVAEVIGTVSCEKVLSFRPSGTTVSGGCPFQLSFTSAPHISYTNGTSSASSTIAQPPAALRDMAIKADWSVSGGTSSLKSFQLAAIVKLQNRTEQPTPPPAGSPAIKPPSIDTRSVSITLGPEARTGAVSLGRVSLVNSGADIVEVRLKAVAEAVISGRNQANQ